MATSHVVSRWSASAQKVTEARYWRGVGEVWDQEGRLELRQGRATHFSQ